MIPIIRLYIRRIGQTNPVEVHRLISKGCIEEKIYKRQIFKHFLAQKVLSDSAPNKAFKTSDFVDLFRFPPVPLALKQDQSKSDKALSTQLRTAFQKASAKIPSKSGAEVLSPNVETLSKPAAPIQTEFDAIEEAEDGEVLNELPIISEDSDVSSDKNLDNKPEESVNDSKTCPESLMALLFSSGDVSEVVDHRTNLESSNDIIISNVKNPFGESL